MRKSPLAIDKPCFADIINSGFGGIDNMWKEYLSIDRNGANSPEEVYTEFENQSDFLAPDCCGGGISLDDIRQMMDEKWITLEDDKISVWVNG